MEESQGSRRELQGAQNSPVLRGPLPQLALERERLGRRSPRHLTVALFLGSGLTEWLQKSHTRTAAGMEGSCRVWGGLGLEGLPQLRKGCEGPGSVYFGLLA